MENEVLKRTFSDKVTLVMIVLFGGLLIGCGLMSLMIYQGTTRTQKFFISDVLPSTIKEVNDQYEINSKLNKIASNNSYSLTNAYVELNPYGNSPLSAIIIFQTRDEEQIRVYINDEYFTTMESSKKHIIPIYGLYDDYENIVKVESSSEKKEYTIKTEKSNITYPLRNNDVEFYNGFTIISGDNITGWDMNKKLRFYLTGNYKNDVDFLPNGHMVIGISEYNNDSVGIIEIDYLGKIYNYYALNYGYSHELQVLLNGNIMISGSDKALYGNKSIIYEIDPRTGNKVNEKNISDIANRNDDITDFYYDESTKELLVAFDNTDDVLHLTDNKTDWIKKKELHDKRLLVNNTMYRVYKNRIYDEVTSNISINSITEYNRVDKENLDESSYRKIDLDKSEQWNNSVVFNRNSFITDYTFDTNDIVDLYLVNKAGKIFIIHYKDNTMSSQGRVYNVNLPVGQYALFIKLNDKLYQTNKVYQF